MLRLCGVVCMCCVFVKLLLFLVAVWLQCDPVVVIVCSLVLFGSRSVWYWSDIHGTVNICWLGKQFPYQIYQVLVEVVLGWANTVIKPLQFQSRVYWLFRYKEFPRPIWSVGIESRGWCKDNLQSSIIKKEEVIHKYSTGKYKVSRRYRFCKQKISHKNNFRTSFSSI